MKQTNTLILVFIVTIVLMSSCSTVNRSMKTPNYHIEFYKTDFDYSKQVVAEATSVRVFGIDWQRLLKWETGQLSSDMFNNAGQSIELSGNIIATPFVGVISAVIPVVGNNLKGKVGAYALHNLMQKNPGYDVVIYPQYETDFFIIPILYSKKTVKVTARLGKIK